MADTYCAVDNKCTSSCVGDATFPVATTYQDTCLTGEVYCIYRGRCLPESDVSSCPAEIDRYEDDQPSAVARSDYDVVHKIDITAADVGVHTFDLGNVYDVEAGYVIGFTASSSSALLSYVATMEEPLEVRYEGTVSVGSRLTEVVSTSWHQVKHSLRVTVAGSLFDNRASFTLDVLGNHQIDVTLNSSHSHPSYSDSAMVLVCDQVKSKCGC